MKGMDLDSPDVGKIALLAQAFAGGSIHPGKQVTRTTYNQRLACISSFYTYAKKHGFVESNPIEVVDRHKVQDYAHTKALDESTVQNALASIDQSDLRGKRDYAILSILFQTARRAQEVTTLQWHNVSISSEGKADEMAALYGIE